MGNPNNCTTQKVERWRSGIYTYLLVTDDRGKAILYNENGPFYCQNSANYNCVTAYNLNELVDQWTCTTNAVSECLVTITNNWCRTIGVFEENGNQLSITGRVPSFLVNNRTWEDARPLNGRDSRTYIFKDGKYELGRATVSCDNPFIDLNDFISLDCPNPEPSLLINGGCKLLTAHSTYGILQERAFPGDTIFLDKPSPLYILTVEEDTVGIGFDFGVRNIDTGACPSSTNYSDVQVFEDYPWLTDLVDLSTCSRESVEVWKTRTSTSTLFWITAAMCLSLCGLCGK